MPPLAEAEEATPSLAAAAVEEEAAVEAVVADTPSHQAHPTKDHPPAPPTKALHQHPAIRALHSPNLPTRDRLLLQATRAPYRHLAIRDQDLLPATRPANRDSGSTETITITHPYMPYT